jgi:exosortase K
VKIKIVWGSVMLLTIWSLKRYYADARADDLWWMLGPTARVTAAITGTSFDFEPGAGYLARERLFLIEKSCAGINFMIAAFAVLALALRHRIRSWSSGLRMHATSLAVSYGAAVAVNATRIAIAMWLASHPAAFSMAPAQVHRVEGIIVSFCGLMLLHELVVRFDRRPVWVGSRR